MQGISSLEKEVKERTCFFFFKLACDSFLFVYLLIFFLKHLITIFLIFSVLFVKNRDSKYV